MAAFAISRSPIEGVDDGRQILKLELHALEFSPCSICGMGLVGRHPSHAPALGRNAAAGIADAIIPDRNAIAPPPEFEQRLLPNLSFGCVVFLQEIDELADA